MTLDSKVASVLRVASGGWSEGVCVWQNRLCILERPLPCCVTSGRLVDLSLLRVSHMPRSGLPRGEVHESLFLLPLRPGGSPFPVVQTGTEPAGKAVEKNFPAERVCLCSLVLCPLCSGKSSRPEKVYQIPFFTRPALNLMENKTEKKKPKAV